MSDTIPTPFAPPAPESIVHETASLQLPAEIGGAALAGTSENGEENETTFEDRLAELQEKIAELPDTTSREIQIDPNNPDRLMNLDELRRRGCGWKIHLNFDPDNLENVAKIDDLLQRLENERAISQYKIGRGGGRKAGAVGKEATVYIGSRDKTDVVAKFISRELEDILEDPDGDTLKHDMLLAKKVMARFDAESADPEFSQYGPNGFPLLGGETHGYGSLLMLYPDKAKRYEMYAIDQELALSRLVEKYGDYFTGTMDPSNPKQQPKFHYPVLNT